MYLVDIMDQRQNDDPSSLDALRRQLLGEHAQAGYGEAPAPDMAPGPPQQQHARPEQQITSGFGMHNDPSGFDSFSAAGMNSELLRQVAGLSGTATPPGEQRDISTHTALQNLLFGARPYEPAQQSDRQWNTNRTLQDLASMLPGSLGGGAGAGPSHTSLPPLSQNMLQDSRLHQMSDATASQLSDPAAWGFGMKPLDQGGPSNLDRYGGGASAGPASLEALGGFDQPLHGGHSGQGGGAHAAALDDLSYNPFPPQAAPMQPQRGMHSIASPAAAAGPPLPGSACTVLAAKVLTESDCKHSRAILPRIAIENNLPFVVGFRTFGLLLPDQDGNEWEFVIKSWANGRSEKSGQTRRKDRRVYVVEQLSSFLAKHALGVGNIIGIVLVDGARGSVPAGPARLRAKSPLSVVPLSMDDSGSGRWTERRAAVPSAAVPACTLTHWLRMQGACRCTTRRRSSRAGSSGRHTERPRSRATCRSCTASAPCSTPARPPPPRPPPPPRWSTCRKPRPRRSRRRRASVHAPVSHAKLPAALACMRRLHVTLEHAAWANLLSTI
jgi:hypothetical protein